MDLDDFFKKAMEQEFKEDAPEKAKDNKQFDRLSLSNAVYGMVTAASMEKMVRLGKAATDKKNELIEELAKRLSTADKTDKALWSAETASHILLTARKITVLDVIIASVALGSMCTDKNSYRDAIDSIITINNII